MGLLSAPVTLPAFAAAPANALLRRLLTPEGAEPTDFSQPKGAPSLIPPDSVSWRVFKNPVSVFIGGVAAVILELGEPRVREGVWRHSRFRDQPAHRLARTGLAAMLTIYGPRAAAEQMIAGVVRMHGRVNGLTPAGEPYSASDPELLDWVQGTAGYGFIGAYHRYVRPLGAAQRDRAHAEAAPAAALYGAHGAPKTEAELQALFARFEPRLERSDIVFEFLSLMQAAQILPAPLRPLQRLMVRGAVAMTPDWARLRLGLGPEWDLGAAQRGVLKRLGAAADRLVLTAHPAVQASRRLGLPDDYVYRP
jgi:uncharacterized protein (DUF2236 family)